MKIIKQEWDGGCGLACIAMICDTTFKNVTKKIKNLRNKTGNSTSIKDFETLLPHYGIECERIKFNSWEKLKGVYIVGVNEYFKKNGKREGWHWVVVIRNHSKFLILDPDDEECINWGDSRVEEKEGYIARKNCDIIKVNMRVPNSIKI